MLRVTIDLIPGGFQPLRRTIASMSIANASDLADISSYLIEAMEGANKLTGTPPRNATCMVHDHDRRQAVWALIAEACTQIQKADFVEL
jgi:hypothetical protein